jgi:catechol 2,3-dioxygenase-like lactoylglutathione lyase family enzyme
MISGYRHTGLVVRNLEKSRAFYENILGLQLWKQAVETGPFIEAVVGIPGVVLEWVKLITPDASLLELLQYHTCSDNGEYIAIQPANKLGCSHIAFSVKDIDALYKTFIEHGFYCNSGPQTSPDGTVKVLYCHDPDGIILEMVEEC